MTRTKLMAPGETPESGPHYEQRVRRLRPGDAEYETWQPPSSATPRITPATCLAGLRGRSLDPVEHRVLKRLGGAGVPPTFVIPRHPRESGEQAGIQVFGSGAFAVGGRSA